MAPCTEPPDPRRTPVSVVFATLSTDERLLLGALSVFDGPATLDGLVAVGEPTGPVLRGLERLRLSALVRLEGGRFRVPGPVRTFVRGALDPAARETFEQRYARLVPRPAPIVADVLRIDPDGGWFAPPNAGPVRCERRASLQAVLARLARERVQRPGMPVPWRELFAAGWPGQNILEHAARNRLKVAIATLRKLGLGGAVRHAGDGYLLEAEVRITRIAS